ncbi:Cytosine deaminase [Sparassis crispa]|uniref:Cytosine deaminase n=1 Tax=Sparassis crispa TaxID=139825 RepID=A0A401G994_9APHY|nr:Cytosine deaminase [Sparassis crispa]GBE78756.1 Cytosine deaminase [Sparassis crispa]
MKSSDVLGLKTALANARKSYDEGGVPIGAALGHNQRIQKSSAILHGETAALKNAGRLKAEVYRQSTMYTTLSPCSMCSGAILLYKIPRLVIGENANFVGDEDLLRSRGVEVVVVEDEECKELMSKFINEKPEEWFEDIGEIPEEHKL